MEDIIETTRQEGCTLTWLQLAEEAQIEDVSTRIIRETMHARGYHVCKACQVIYVDKDLAPRREKWARDMLAKYPRKEDWRQVQWSDESHASFGPQGRLNVIRKASQRGHPDCVQEVSEPKEKDRKRQHFQAAIRWNFKSDITFYDVPGNSNRKMTHRVYIDSILEPVVKPWLEASDDFVLEEDGDSGHSYNKNRTNNIVTKQKKQYGLITIKNCAGSPDLAPIENSWQPVKHMLRSKAHWDDDTIRELIIEGWNSLKQETINAWIDDYPNRLRAVINAQGKMTHYQFFYEYKYI